MAAKRSASSELNHDNWENEDEPEERGTFKKASEDALKTRLIKTARRRNPIREEGSTPSAFVGFTGFSAKPPTADFSFLKDVSGTPKTNGVASQDSKPNPFAQSETKTVPKFTFGASSQPSSEPEEYYSRLKGLNESVSKWIAKKVEENPLISLQPIFKDYDKYLAEIEADRGEKPKPAVPTFSFTIPSKTTQSEEKSSQSAAPTFIFGATANSGGTSKPFSTLGSASTPAPPISFGNTSQPVVKPAENDVTTEDNEDEPPKVEVTPVVENDYIYTVRCKVFVKKGSDYSDRGVGNLYLKPIENSEKKQLIVRADTNLGNLLLNFILSDSVPVKRLGKKDVMVVAVPTPDEKPPPTPLLLRVKSPEEADNLLDTLEKNKK